MSEEIKMPDTEEILRKIDLYLDSVDQWTRDGLTELSDLQHYKQRAGVQKRKRAIIKYGHEDPKAHNATANLKSTQDFLNAIKIEKDKADITPTDIREDAWLLHGRVLDERRNGVKGQTVSLFGKDQKWVRELGFACTDERGYFAITYPEKEGSPVDIPDTQALFLTLTDQQNQVIHREDEPLFVAIGRVDYREILLSGPEETCAPPETTTTTTEPPPAAGEQIWRVRGRVTGQDNQPVRGLTVSLYDKDLLFDDLLGTTLTDEAGRFQFYYEAKAFRDLFEKRPDLYLKVMDAKGKVLYKSRKVIRFEAGNEEVFDIRIKRK